MANINYWKQIADGMSIDYSTYNDISLQYEETWIKILGELLTGEPLSDTYIPLASQTDRIQAEVDNMPDKESLVGLWFPGYDPTNQVVKDWSGSGNDGLRGNSETFNTSSPDGASFNGNQFIQVAYAANMNTVTLGAVTLGSVAAQSLAVTSSIAVSQNNFNRALHYVSNGNVFGYLGRYRLALSNRVLNTFEHYMVAGGSGMVNMYKDGLVSSANTSGTYNSDEAAQPLYIGRSPAGNYFTGQISCAYMYINSAQDANAALINTTINNILTILAE